MPFSPQLAEAVLSVFEVRLVENTRQVDVLAGAHAACFTPPSHDNSIAETFYLPGFFGMVGSDKADGAVVGFAVCRVILEEAELLSIGIIPERRRLGWGRAILCAVLSEARANGANTIVLEVAEENEAAQSLYRALGFTHVGRRAKYYDAEPGRRISADIMRCGL